MAKRRILHKGVKNYAIKLLQVCKEQNNRENIFKFTFRQYTYLLKTWSYNGHFGIYFSGNGYYDRTIVDVSEKTRSKALKQFIQEITDIEYLPLRKNQL